MLAVLNCITQGASMQVRQPVNQGCSKDGENEPRLVKMSHRRSYGSSGHDSACNHALAVDHSQRVAFTLQMPCTAVLIYGHRHPPDPALRTTGQASHVRVLLMG